MTFQEIAVLAANKVRQDSVYATQEAFAQAVLKYNRIAVRWNLIWVPSLQAYFPENETIRQGTTFYHVDDATSCQRCEELTMDPSGVNDRNNRGRLTVEQWCSDCQSDDSFCCRGCDEQWEDDECHSYNGDSYCVDCHSNLERDEVPCYHSAHRWDVQDHNVPLYSMELELESDERCDLIDHLNHLSYPRVSWEMDGSLDRAKGLEILIQLRESTDKLSNDVRNLLSNIKKKGFSLSSWDNKRCGIHINSNRTPAWDKRNTMRLIYAVRMAQESLIKISGRDNAQWASWDARGHSLTRQSEGSLGKYTMIRVGCDRFEWRMFRGTLNEGRITLYCETVKQFEALALSNASNFKLKQAAIDLGNKLANTL
jgi:hypothetical protein